MWGVNDMNRRRIATRLHLLAHLAFGVSIFMAYDARTDRAWSATLFVGCAAVVVMLVAGIVEPDKPVRLSTKRHHTH